MTSIVISILLIGFGILLIANKKKEKDKMSSENSENDSNALIEDFTEDFDKKYFEEIEKGEPFQQFLILGGQQDCALIRSLLAADGIPSFVENENINRMYGGIASSVTGAFAIKLYILIKDYDKAYEIVCDYTKSKQEDIEKQEKEVNPLIKTGAAVVTGLFFSPFPVNAIQKSMGITVLPKVTEN